MHYANGREAKPGDRVIVKNWDGTVKLGLVVTINPSATTCNAGIIPIPDVMPTHTLGECLHVEDAIDMGKFEKKTE